MKPLSPKAKRNGLAVIGVLLAITVINYYAKWNLFGGYDGAAMMLCVLLGVVFLSVFGPTRKEIEEAYNSGERRRLPLVVSPLTKTAATVVLAILVLFTSVNAFGKLGWFGAYSGEVVGLSIMALIFARVLLKSRRPENGDE